MGNRLIREDILDSGRVQALPVEARWLFLSVMLTADDIGLFEASAFKLSRRANIGATAMPAMLAMLADVDLIRLYTANGKQYGFVPRFRQRLQVKRSRHPLPPASLLVDDEDASSKINNLGSNPTVDHRGSPRATVAQPSEPEPEPEEKDIEATPLVDSAGAESPKAAFRVSPCPTQELVDLYHQKLPALPTVAVVNDSRKRAIAARWREVCAADKMARPAGIEFFAWFFDHVGKSDFLMGRTPGKSGRVWAADLDFLMTASKFPRVIEGAYHKGVKA